MKSPETLGVVFWNTLYRADPYDQIVHIAELERQLDETGVHNILLCLSEVTRSDSRDNLWARLRDEGYDAAFRPTSDLGWAEEGLCLATRTDQLDGDATPQFTELRRARAIANTKTRWLGHVTLSGVSVFTAHTSYPFPPKQEVRGISQAIEAEWQKTRRAVPQLLGGDFNTVLRRNMLPEMEKIGLTKLRPATGSQATVPLGPISEIGFELDHAFISVHDMQKATLTIGSKGPSNHKPLLVTVQT